MVKCCCFGPPLTSCKTSPAWRAGAQFSASLRGPAIIFSLVAGTSPELWFLCLASTLGCDHRRATATIIGATAADDRGRRPQPSTTETMGGCASKAEPREPTPAERESLFSAAETDDAKQVKRMLKSGIVVDARDEARLPRGQTKICRRPRRLSESQSRGDAAAGSRRRRVLQRLPVTTAAPRPAAVARDGGGAASCAAVARDGGGAVSCSGCP